MGYTKLHSVNWLVSVGTPSHIIYGDLRMSLFRRLIIYSLIFSGALAAALYYADTIYQKIKSLQLDTEQIAKGNLEKPIDSQGTDEVGDLAGAMERMRQNLLNSHQALQKSELCYRELVETSKALLITHDLTGRIISINKDACHALGYKPEEVVGKNIKEFMEPSVTPFFDIYVQELQKHGKAKGLITLLDRSGGKQVWG